MVNLRYVAGEVHALAPHGDFVRDEKVVGHARQTRVFLCGLYQSVPHPDTGNTPREVMAALPLCLKCAVVETLLRLGAKIDACWRCLGEGLIEAPEDREVRSSRHLRGELRRGGRPGMRRLEVGEAAEAAASRMCPSCQGLGLLRTRQDGRAEVTEPFGDRARTPKERRCAG